MDMSELASLPLFQRLQAMEVLWDSLCREASYDPSAEWHREVLVERAGEIEAGKFENWDEAKAQLRAGAESFKQSRLRA